MPERETKRFFSAHELAENLCPGYRLDETCGGNLTVRDGYLSTAVSE
jgi:hypothetical protein